MSNIAQVLKAEISRISKREAKALITPIRKSSAKLRPDVADLKARLAVLEKSNRELQKQVATLIASQPAPAEAPEGRAWISGKGVKALRRKLGLTQGELAKLTGVSTGAVVQWESKAGMLKLRDATKKAIMAIRGIGKAEARKRLAELAPAKGKKAKVAKGKVKGKKAGLKRRK
jgi:DNA-binding transcriptional regulator YiaG